MSQLVQPSNVNGWTLYIHNPLPPNYSRYWVWIASPTGTHFGPGEMGWKTRSYRSAVRKGEAEVARRVRGGTT